VKQTPANQPTSRPADPPQSAPVCIMRTAANFAGDEEEGCVRFVRVHIHTLDAEDRQEPRVSAPRTDCVQQQPTRPQREIDT